MSAVFRHLLTKTPWSRRCYSKAKTNIPAGMPDSLELCTGKQRREVQAYVQGNCDPYNIMVLKRGDGTKENPTMIPSAFNGRIVGCICQENRFVNYMWVEKGCPKRCECGHWYKLKEVKAM